MHKRLAAAVRALLASTPDLSDAARLLRIVVTAKARHADGCVTSTRVPELARWLGVGCSTVDKALAELRGAKALETSEKRVRGAVVGLTCRVPGVSAASSRGTDPLALTRTELATLLRLVEPLFAPGWVHRDGSRTPAGLLGERTGRGAPTDRLALLLLVLETRPNGRVRLCGGAVDTRIGRPATTAARLLGATAYQGARILARLQRAGAVVLERRPTGSGLAGRGEIRIPAVAAAYQGLGGAHRNRPRIADRAVAAVGDRPATTTEEPQVTPAPFAETAGIPDQDDAVDLHAHHSLVVAEGELSAGQLLASGEAAYGVPADAGGARGRARTAPPMEGSTDPAVDLGALRAESKDHDHRNTAGSSTDAEPDSYGLRQRQRTALRPVGFVLDALTPGQRAVALRAVDVVLHRVSAEALADQLASRIGPMSLEGPKTDRGVIRDPLAWLLSQLPSITLCGTCRTRTTTGSPAARTAQCDQCTRARAERTRGRQTCPGCGDLGRLGDRGQCGRCDHRQALEEAGDQAASAATARFPDDQAAPARARRSVAASARAAATEAARRGTDPVMQELAARLAAYETASAWWSSAPVPTSSSTGAGEEVGPQRWTCASAKCSRQSTAAAPESHLCSTCERERQLQQIRAARHLRLAQASAT